MPYSYKNCLAEITEYLKKNFEKGSVILDVGCGSGSWSDILHELGYYNINGIEVYKPYVEQFNLHSKYDTLLITDVRDFIPQRKYDLVIMGDILEHLSHRDSIKVIGRLKAVAKNILIIVPYLLPQVVTEGNTLETHLQPDLTAKVFKTRYPEFTCISEKTNLGITQGAWVWKSATEVISRDFEQQLSRQQFIQQFAERNRISFEEAEAIFIRDENKLPLRVDPINRVMPEPIPIKTINTPVEEVVKSSIV